MKGEDRDLGMGCPISRRDFVNGVAVAAGAGVVMADSSAFAQPVAADAMTSANYPPLRHGFRGDHVGANTIAHTERDGRALPEPEDIRESYDLVVVGAGLSGLAAAWFYRERAGASARILILDNHDDFGGHATRNEYSYQGRKFIISGGSARLSAIHTFPYEATRLLRQLGVERGDPSDQNHPEVYKSLGMGAGTFFNKAAYGKDQLVLGGSLQNPTPEFLARTPLSATVKADLLRLMTAKTDYLPGLSKDEKIAKLRAISYRDYLLDVVKVHPDVLAYTNGVWCLGNDTASAWFAYYRYKPGFDGLGVPRPPGAAESPEHVADIWAMPAGNSDLARLMVRSLIPAALPPGSLADVETARVNYAALDVASSPTRLRLGSTVIRARHVGTLPHQFEPDNREVEVSYVTGGKAYRIRAKDVVMAGMNNMIPYICPELPDEQKAALHKAMRAINHETNALFRNWEAFAKLKVANIACPRSFYSGINLMQPRSFGAIKPVTDPAEPILVRFPGGTGLSNETFVRELLGADPVPGTPLRDQMRAARAGLLRTPFEHFERALRSQAVGALAGSDFDPARDIVDITVNRWGHGYALGRNHLFDDENAVAPCIIARRKFGHITIANSDSSGMDLAETAIDEAARAVRELETRFYGSFETI
jgi:spermidine dehydrogenase